MKDDILQQIGKYKAPKKLPTISMQAYALYEASGFKLTDADLALLRESLVELGDDLKALTDANVGLGVFALYLRDTKKDSVSAEQIAQLVRETAPKYASIGERIMNALQDLAISATGLLDRFSERDETAKARAPKFGDDSPSGTLSLKDLKPVGGARPPPRSAKKKPTR